VTTLRTLCAIGALALACAGTAAAAAPERVSFPSLDGAGNAPVVLTGYFLAAPTAAASAPAIAMFHGCDGALDKRGELSRRMHDYAELLNGLGLHVLIVDSLTARYEKEICTQRIGKRRVTQSNRRLDALGAVEYLAGRADVDAHRIGLIGWSNGASTVLAATNLHHRDVAAAEVKPAFAIAFYPGCEADLKRGYAPSAPLARAAAAPKPEIESYAGAWHGFDSASPVRLRKDVPNGVHPGQGVHVGGDAAAWRASRDRVVRFVAEH
jgi:dienelactone hydrolase